MIKNILFIIVLLYIGHWVVQNPEKLPASVQDILSYVIPQYDTSIEGYWKLVDITSESSTSTTSNPEEEIILSFASSTIGIISDCIIYTGSFKLVRDKIRVNTLVPALTFCTPTKELELRNELEKGLSYEQNNDSLRLFSEEDREIIFQKTSLPSREKLNQSTSIKLEKGIMTRNNNVEIRLDEILFSDEETQCIQKNNCLTKPNPLLKVTTLSNGITTVHEIRDQLKPITLADYLIYIETIDSELLEYNVIARIEKI
jgi:heat shock protein HslJ